MRKTTLLIVLSVAVSISVSGCVRTTRYTWGGYDQSLYNYYRDPGVSAKHAECLQAAIKEGELDGTVPPGLYAEYGYALLEAGQSAEAVSNFNKEKEKWPESSFLMEKLIRNASKMRKEPGLVSKSELKTGEEGAK